MTPTTPLIVFDVNETLSDMSPLAERFREIGAPASLSALWFATLLRDGFALTASGDHASFAEIGADALRRLVVGLELDRAHEAAVAHVMSGLVGLDVHADVPEGIRLLSAADCRLVTLSNGSARIAEALLQTAGIRSEFEALLSVDDAPAWKPARSAYDYAATVCGTEPADMMLVAVHPWDIHGAARAGLRTAWLNRSGERYPAYFEAPTVTVADLTELPAALGVTVHMS
ncbi:haloacid dehalogenase type II [Cryobacterium sp. CG_9.6]|uniref:haloacid dehalogenase type II n=1 Tax=Cryobacterium sp. CG_9.6 TaxID=2760710 RepID=UPI0024761760|nr:haloacid dehalogenase type II [Cryobacterium sp. CG_9.6]MDH6238161.1 2-haloacid dehalogenase [Cryobacterium sp. CG_9.6]